MLREVFVTYPDISFNVARQLDNRLSAVGSVELLGVSPEDFSATYAFIQAQIAAHFEDESLLISYGTVTGEASDEQYDFTPDVDFYKQ